MTIGTITNTISKASSTKADRANTTSPVMAAPVAPPGTSVTQASSTRSVPKVRNTRVKVVAATNRANSAPVTAMVSRSTWEKTPPRRPPVDQPNSSNAVPPMAAASTA